jgi:hypothetical protein
VLYVQDKFTGSKSGQRITDAIWVDHGTFVIRYGETEPGSAVDYKGKRIPKWRLGTRDSPIAEVRKGQMLGRVGDVGNDRMLHFEIFYGDATGSLSDSDNTTYPYLDPKYAPLKFKRRWDLLDPTEFLDLMATNSGLLPPPKGEA